MTRNIDAQLQHHLRTLAETPTRSSAEVERDVFDRAVRRRRRRQVRRVVGGLAAVGLVFIGVSLLRDDDTGNVGITDTTAPDTSSGSTDSSAPASSSPGSTNSSGPSSSLPESTDSSAPTDTEPGSTEQGNPRITDVRLGRHEGFDRIVIEFSTDLAADDLAEVDDVAASWEAAPAFSIDDDPHYGECGDAIPSVEGASFVNVIVPSDWLGEGEELEPHYSSADTVKVNEVALCSPYEGRANLAIALAEPGEVDAQILDDPGRVVIDIR